MITKPWINPCDSASGHDDAHLKDPRVLAGREAEKQMAFYLHRAFAAHPEIFILHDLRILDPEQPEHDGSPGICQIDHLIIHRWGMFIVETKSIHDRVIVRDDGAGGDEWARSYRGNTRGFPSPIQQARRQGELLRQFLQRHRTQLLGRMAIGLRTITRVVAGTDQRGFLSLPIQPMVAISDRGQIQRMNGWEPPATPFQVHVCKADQVPDRVLDEIRRHANASRLHAKPDGAYGVWSMKLDEAAAVAAFLASQHHAQPGRSPLGGDIERPSASPIGLSAEAHGSLLARTSATTPTERAARPTLSGGFAPAAEAPVPTDSREVATTVGMPPVRSVPAPRSAVAETTAAACGTGDGTQAAGALRCRHCSAFGPHVLTPMWGRFGPYVRCEQCQGNTNIPSVCSACGADGRKDRTVVIRREAASWSRHCAVCGMEELLWTSPAERK